MAKTKKQSSLLIPSLVAVLVSQSLVIPVTSAPSVDQDQKTYYHHPPQPGTTPPTDPGFHTPSHHGSGGSYGSKPPSHGTPSHGGGSSSHGKSPPAYCGTPPSGGHHNPKPPTTSGSPHTPATPTYENPPTTPSNSGTPSTPAYSSPPTTPSINPGTPSTPTYSSPPKTPYIDPGTPSTPTYGSPPTIPSIDPGTPSPPISHVPDSPPFSCNYWRSHPALIWGLFGFWGATVGGAFGGLHSSSYPGLGSQCSLEQALSNTRTDGYGALYREGTASLLNSMITHSFPYTTEQVRENFLSALGSSNAAAAQAQVFKQANEAH